jgi:hypothetical protein
VTAEDWLVGVMFMVVMVMLLFACDRERSR